VQLLLKADAFHGLGGAKPFIEFTAIKQVLKLNLIKSPAFARLYRIAFYRHPERVLVFDNIAGLNLIAVHFHGAHTFKY